VIVIKLYIVTLLFFISIIAANNEKTIEVGIDEKLGQTIPLDVRFTDSDGKNILLSDIIDKPFLLTLVYYECPGICSPMLTEVAWVADRIDLVPGEDFKIITLSFDHHEGIEQSSKWKKNYLQSIKRNFPDSAWVFLTGDSLNIKKVTDAAGFYFKPVKEDFTHAFAMLAVSPKGKIARYIYGSDYNQFDVKMALLDAESGKSSPTVAKILQFCFSYDPEGRRYTLNITRIIGTVMLLAVGIFVTVLVFKGKKKSRSIDG
jgi:protein SCO1/2